MHGRGAALGAVHVQTAMTEIDAIPTQRYKLADAQPMPIGDQHHGGVAMAVAVVTSGLDQALNLGLGKVFARSDLGIRTAPGRTFRVNCPIKARGVTKAKCGFFIGFASFSMATVPNMTAFGTSSNGKPAILPA
jgi:hypothetical protein